MAKIENGVFRICGLDTPFAPGPWAFFEREREKIDAHWARAIAEKPKLFDGRVLLMRDAALVDTRDGAILRGKFFATDFRAFHAWLHFGSAEEGVYNCFGMAGLKSRDGAFVLGEMGPHTVNAGKIYFAAGTPDLSDIFGDRVDLAASIAREMTEETGFAAEEALPESGFWASISGGKIAVIQTRRLALSAAEAISRAEKFIAAEPEPELTRLVAALSPEDVDAAATPDFIQAFLRQNLPSRPEEQP